MRFLVNIFKSKQCIVVIIISLFVLTMQAQAQAQDKGLPKDKKEKTSYAVGVDMGVGLSRQMKELSVEIDADMVAQGLKDGYVGKPKLSEEELRTVLTELTKEMQTKQSEKMKTVGDKNKLEGEAFLSQNAKASGIHKLPSGLQYKVIKEGAGKTPKSTDTVIVNYKGTLIDGTEFDSSFKRNQPLEIKVNGVIPGWTEILQKMKEGSRYTVYIPSNLAYGERGAGAIIGPNAVLIFDVELLTVK
jgi:FKBP-type peptidyl-prolyl cis-trans isomerase FklB